MPSPKVATSTSPSIHDNTSHASGEPTKAYEPDSPDLNHHSDSPPMESTVDTPASPQTHGGSDDRSTSHGSRRSSKRKATVEDDDYIANNPELYGLRRSTRTRNNARQVIESSSGEEESEVSDVEKPRKKRRTLPPQKASKRPTPATRRSTSGRSTSVPSDSDSFGGNNRRRGAGRKRGTTKPAFDGGLAAALRASTRRGTKVMNYNEDDEDETSQDNSEMLTPANWAGAAEDNRPAIDTVLKYRVKEGDDQEQIDISRDAFEYFIKWQGKAHYHSTWEEGSTLATYRGARRLDNYYRKIVLQDIRMSKDADVPPEDKEKWNLDREQEAEALEDYMKIERVIGKRDGEDETEYFVKWKGLCYDSCTWEMASLVSNLSQTEIDRYLDRSSRLPASLKTESNLATRSKHTPIREQPSYVKNGKLRDFQVTGLNFLAYNWCKGKNVILADEMGLGKTVQTVSFLNWLVHERHQQGPFLVIVPLSTVPSWADTFSNWAPELNVVVYNGNEAAREIIRDYEVTVNGGYQRVKFNVLLTTYEYALNEKPMDLSLIKWQFMAVDEAHRLKNRESQLYGKLLGIKAPGRLLITGTPMQNTLGELAALMDFLMPGTITIDENMDLQSDAAGQKLAELTEAIQPYMLRRTKQKVENDLPPKTEKIIRVELSDIQLEYYKAILTRNYAALNKGATGPKQALLNIMAELKKVSNHPYIFTANAEERLLNGSTRREDRLKSIVTSSGKMMLLDQLLTKLKKDNHRVLIFSQMVKMLNILSEYMSLRGYQHQRLDGNIAAGARRMAIDHFNAPESNDFCFLLSTRAGGLGINLMTADTVVLFDSDWNPQADLQAMARAHRIGQKNPVNVYRLVSKETVEEEILERARNKLMLEFITIQRGVTDKDAQDLSDKMVKAGRNVSEPTSSADISKILKRRGQKMFEQSDNQKKLEELDIDTVLANAEEHQTEGPEGMVADGGEEFLKSFEYMDVKIDAEWDDIIPREQLDELKAEEKRKADEEYLNQVIEQNAPRKRKAAATNGREERAAKRARDTPPQEDKGLGEGPVRDPKRPLTEKELRNLVRAYLRYGSLDTRREELLEDAQLVGRDLGILREAIDEIRERSLTLLREERARVAAIEAATRKLVTKKDQKAVLFDHRGVKRLNAETIVDRPGEMELLRSILEGLADLGGFRVPEAVKAAHYSCPWGAREDGMLLVGIHKHGYGAWVQIRDDSGLDLTDKLFLEEHRVEKKGGRAPGDNAKSPGAVHLVRRADYLLSVLKERGLLSAQSSSKKSGVQARKLEGTASVSASPAPAAATSRKGLAGADKTRTETGNATKPSLKRKSTEADDEPRSKRARSDDRTGGQPHSSRPKAGAVPKAKKGKSTGGARREERTQDSSSGVRSPPLFDIESWADRDEGSIMVELFRPVEKQLKTVRNLTREGAQDRAALAEGLKENLLKIGKYLKGLCGEEPTLEPRYWEFIASYWANPNKKGSSVKALYERLVAQ
ncbi:MAG: hypothetical protein M1816_000810 [Peltula sp. TS41687]|nr:MAG: hypothetical protein M1816_000810 [Peltula sp. TS41687]